MVFSNLFFIYLFLPLNLIMYFLAKDIKTKNVIMLVFSLFFYAWGSPKYLILLLSMALGDFFLAKFIDSTDEQSKKKLGLIGACVLDLGLLGIFKYFGFVLTNVQNLTGFPENIPEIVLPIGISFYTFQLLSYVVDVYRGEVEAQKDFSKLLLYVSLFHQCIAGPIVRYSDVQYEIMNRKTDWVGVSRGICRFSVGLGKKVLLANVCGSLTDMLLISDADIASQSAADSLAVISSRPALALWVGVLCYMLQIYLDFSAYSDMAIGMGLMIGFHYKENFDYPYTSKSVAEFWRRWHISLGSFFRDYVYIPLGGNRKGMKRTIFNTFVVWALTGFWHGASWNFVLWGLYFCLFIIMERLFLSDILKKLPSFVSSAYLLIVVYFGWVLFKFKDMSMVTSTLKGMFCLNDNAFTSYEVSAIIKNNIFFLIVAIISVTPLMMNLSKKLIMKARKNAHFAVFNSFRRIVIPVVLLLLATFALVGDSYNPFLYFQF